MRQWIKHKIRRHTLNLGKVWNICVRLRNSYQKKVVNIYMKMCYFYQLYRNKN